MRYKAMVITGKRTWGGPLLKGTGQDVWHLGLQHKRAERHSIMTDITDREGCYGSNWQAEPDKEADTWESEVVYG